MNGAENDQEAILIEVLGQMPQSNPGQWEPQIREETLDLIQTLDIPQTSRFLVVQEAANILSRCIPPNVHEGHETGIVVGYIQSGKTMSFTTVAALARDNDYRLVIVVAGTSTHLLDQSRQRLINDLRLRSRSEFRPWLHVPDPALNKNSHLDINDNLDEWNDNTVPTNERRAVLITVMKHCGHLQNLIDVLQRVNLEEVPTLIIDDEGDQAGLNTQVRKRDRSTTYQRLLELKAAIPHHSYLLYTATPQAPLLINIVDVLSPGFAEVISSGDGYTGGQEFFSQNRSLVRDIPQDEIPTQENLVTVPPLSLLRAMRLFFLGAAAHLASGDPTPNRSMMVHPSRLTEQHGQYYNWVDRARRGWLQILTQPDNESDREDLLQVFRQDYEDLQSTESSVPSFDSLVGRLHHALRRTRVREVNAVRGRTVPVVWSSSRYWILVGGQAMDRGFTVEGLTVTYMPRGPGVGNADTIQQRARFFGYKQGYQGYCRIFLEPAVSDAFREYVEHEEDIRRQLLDCRNSGRPLSEWKRQFFLTRALRPTRASVIDIAYRRPVFGNKWKHPQGLHDTEEAIEFNREVFDRFIGMLTLEEHGGMDRRTTDRKNMVARTALRLVHDELLSQIRLPRLDDTRLLTLLIRMIEVHMGDTPDATCAVFLMARGNITIRGYENHKIKELFQGRQYDRGGLTYMGDRQVKENDHITLQLRYLTLRDSNNRIFVENVPHIAFWVPSSIARDVVQQPQGG